MESSRAVGCPQGVGLRYIAAAVILVGTFAAALYLRGERGLETPDATPGFETVEALVLEVTPDVRTQSVEGGTELRVRLCFAGSCSRAKLVYEHQGKESVLDATTNCRRSLAPEGSKGSDGYVSEVDLGGMLPTGASNVRIVLESETGIRIARVEL